MLAKKADSPISGSKIRGLESAAGRNRAVHNDLLLFFYENVNFDNNFFEIVVKMEDLKKSDDIGSNALPEFPFFEVFSMIFVKFR